MLVEFCLLTWHLALCTIYPNNFTYPQSGRSIALLLTDMVTPDPNPKIFAKFLVLMSLLLPHMCSRTFEYIVVICISSLQEYLSSSFQINPIKTRPHVPTVQFYTLAMDLLFIWSNYCSIHQVEFHDTSRGHRIAPLADYFGFTMAALGEKGSVLANPQRDKTPSTLIYRPFASWASNSEVCF